IDYVRPFRSSSSEHKGLGMSCRLFGTIERSNRIFGNVLQLRKNALHIESRYDLLTLEMLGQPTKVLRWSTELRIFATFSIDQPAQVIFFQNIKCAELQFIGRRNPPRVHGDSYGTGRFRDHPIRNHPVWQRAAE